MRIVHLSDLQTVGACERERVALERVRELDPDLVVLTGDYIAGPFFDTGPAAAAARAFLAGLSARHGVIAVAGHSEVEEHRAQLFLGLDLVYLKNAEHRIDLGDGRTKVISKALFFTTEERDGMVQSGMEQGLNQSYAALDALLEKLA